MQQGKPLLGICLGLQIVLEHTEEGDQTCLGLVEGACERFEFADRSLKVPHIGWNELTITLPHPMLENIQSGDEFYFVHSYFAQPIDNNHVVGTTQYGDQDLLFCHRQGKSFRHPVPPGKKW